MKRTYSFNVEELLYQRYAVCSGLAAPRGGASENVAVFEGEGDRLLLYSGRTRKSEVCEGTEDKRGEEICKGCECFHLRLLGLRLGLRLSHLRSFVRPTILLQIPTCKMEILCT
jgi:hypothetical protein